MATRNQPPTYEEFLHLHSAGLKSLGFDEQFACFVYHLLDMKAGDSISYEKEDDVAIHRKNGNIELYQVKNSVEV